MTMQQMVETYINGNISDARKSAKRRSHKDIRDAFLDFGYSFYKATLTADFLKTGIGFQEACDAD